MTSEAGGPRPGVPRLWVLPLGVLAGSVFGAAVDVLSGALILDLVGWWPVWLVLAGSAVLFRRRLLGRVRVSGLIPLVGLIVVVGFVIGHTRGWAIMPSAAIVLIGPETTGVEIAILDVAVDDAITVAPGARFLYEISPVRWGGDLAMPEAMETTQQDQITIELTPLDDPGLATFAGWDVLLSSEVRWDIDITGILDADLSGLDLRRVEVDGSGIVTLGTIDRPVEADIDGAFTMRVPADAPVEVIGRARVPRDWEQTETGWRSPTSGRGWTLRVATGAEVLVTDA